MKKTSLLNLQQHMVEDRLEIELIPFTKCNIDCDFCEYKNCRVDIEPDFFARAEKMIDQQYTGQSVVVIEMWGGELLSDNIPAELLCQYELFLEKMVRKYGDKLDLGLKTNLIHHNSDFLIKLCKKYSCLKIGTSFDFVGRFKKQSQFDTFASNLMILDLHGIHPDITIVAHKLNIDAVLSQSSKEYRLFKCLYDAGKWNIDFEYYDDVNALSDYAVSDAELTLFLKHLVNYYPEISEARKLITRGVSNNVDNTSIVHDGMASTYVCMTPFETVIESGKDHLNHMFDTKRCIACKWFGLCSPRYPVEMNDSAHCFNYELFEYIANGKQL